MRNNIDETDEYAVRRLSQRGGGGYIKDRKERYVAPRPVPGEKLRPLEGQSKSLWNRFKYSGNGDER